MSKNTTDPQIAHQIETMAGLGLPLKMMAQIVGIPATTIHRNYEEQLLLGKSKASLNVSKVLYSLATNQTGDVPHAVQFQAAKYWATTQMGWSETAHLTVEHQNVPVHINFVSPQYKELTSGQERRSETNGTTKEANDDRETFVSKSQNSSNEPESVQGEQTLSIQPTFIRH